MDEDNVLKVEDVEDVLNFHKRKMKSTEVEHLAGTINYALDKFFSGLVDSMREEGS